MWQITISKADNGFVLEYYDEETETNRQIAVEDPPDGDETVTTQKMLWEIMEHFSLFGSKHDKVRVKVVRRDSEEKDL